MCVLLHFALLNSNSSKFFLQYTIIFVDSEGIPTQELSAIEMDYNTREIVDVYHAYAYTDELDWYARNHVHGLSLDYLKKYGHPCTEALHVDFKNWLRPKNVIMIYANDPNKESRDLNLNICDIGLDKWLTRSTKPYHSVALCFKRLNIPILGTCCSAVAHSMYRGLANKRLNNCTDSAKEHHGYHCSLYDCYELYLCYITTD